MNLLRKILSIFGWITFLSLSFGTTDAIPSSVNAVAPVGLETDKPISRNLTRTQGNEKEDCSDSCTALSTDSASAQLIPVEKNLYQLQDFMDFFESFETNFKPVNGCLDTLDYWKDEDKIPRAFKGMLGLNDKCNPHALNEQELCKTYETVGDCKKRLTGLVCEGQTCSRTLAVPNPKSMTALTDMDAFGCSNIYQIRADIPQKFVGGATYRMPCSLFPTSEAETCRVFTTAPRYKNPNDPEDDHTECVKPTHLYCDPIMQVCLCGDGHDEVRFQFSKDDTKCYVRPTFDVVESYLCSPGSEPATRTLGSVSYHFCRCLSSMESFNSSDPDWWTCGSSDFLKAQLYPLFIAVVVSFYW